MKIFNIITFIFTLSILPANAQSPANLNDSIGKYRMGYVVVKTTPNAKVSLEQVKHEFWFGAALANHIFEGNASEADIKTYKEKFLQNFNSAVTENALKWGSMEPVKGKVNFATVDNMLKWTEENDIHAVADYLNMEFGYMLERWANRNQDLYG